MLNPQDRLKEINNLFLRKALLVNYRSVEQYLLEHFDIPSYSERSFSRDVNTLKELLKERYPSLEEEQGELIRYSRSNLGFYYIRQDISAFPSFSEKELNQIASIIDLNQHLFTDGAGQGIVNKLRAITLENNLSKYNQLNSWPSIQLIKDGERAGSDNIKPILEAIAAKDCLLFTYQALSKEAIQKKYSGIPLMIKEYNNGWYTGWYVLIQEVKEQDRIVKTEINSLRLFALDRMLQLRVHKSTCQLRFAPGFYPPDYFTNMLGILRNNLANPGIKSEKVTVHLSTESWMLDYLTKYPLHPSQQIDKSSQGIQITWNLEINVELESFFMRYAHDLTVISPKSLKEKLKHNLIEALKNLEEK